MVILTAACMYMQFTITLYGVLYSKIYGGKKLWRITAIRQFSQFP